MGKISSRQSTGSSLLITVLIMTVVGMVVLVVSRNAILSTRVASQNDSSNLAFQMAMTGLEDGRLRAQLFGGAPLTAQGEFGDLTSTASNPHIVNPRRRGYLMTDASSACTNPGSDQSVSTSATTVNQSCPYYDLAVYRLITITPTTSFYYTDKEIPPNNTAVNLKILQTNNPGFTLTPHFLNAGDPNAKMTVQAGTYSCTTGSGTPNCLVPAGNTIVSISSGSPLDPSQGIQVTSGSTLVIDRGFTTVDAIGYAGGIQRHLAMVIWNKVVGPPTISEVSQTQNYYQYALTDTF